MLQAFWHFLGRQQQKGITARSRGLQQAKLGIVDLGVGGDIRQVAAHQREMMFVVYLANAANPLNRILVAKMATDGITGISGINHHAAITDDFDRLPNQSRLRIVGMNNKKLSHMQQCEVGRFS